VGRSPGAILNPLIIGAVFAIMFLAELGDKTQLVLLTLGARHDLKATFLGAISAFFLLNVMAVAVGTFFYELIPARVMGVIAGALLVLVGLLSFRPEKRKEAGIEKVHKPFLRSFALIMLMELGDKTQLSLLALTARYRAPFAVFTGATAALWLSAFLAVFLGNWLSRFVSVEKMRLVTGVVFIVFGIALILGLA